MTLAHPTTPRTFSQEELLAASEALRSASADVILGWIERQFGASAAIASSFGAEDVVLIDLARKHAPSLRLFTLDTGRLPPETYELIETLRNRYGLEIETFLPDRERVEALESSKGFFSFRKSLEARKECCAIRKVEPLRRALAGRQAWVTGLRREQSVTRTSVELIERDAEHGGVVKLNPLAQWSSREVWAYIQENGVPYNALHDRGYPSIGCAPCTRAVKPYEDERAGRWWWESAENRECGLHVRR
jgi:phosphoadenosine phosphosulfate reductase